jgi:large subunit ribosomal protein L6
MLVEKFFVKYFRSILMSRVGQAVINSPDGVEVKKVDNTFLVKGTKGELSAPISETVEVIIEQNVIKVEPRDKNSRNKALWGTTRALINNAIQGVKVGFEKEMEIVGVGYRGALQGKKLTLNLGLSHVVEIEVPDYISIKMDGNTKFTISSADKQKLGEFAAMVRSKRPPEPFKGKGIRYSNEFILRKEGKKK